MDSGFILISAILIWAYVTEKIHFRDMAMIASIFMLLFIGASVGEGVRQACKTGPVDNPMVLKVVCFGSKAQ